MNVEMQPLFVSSAADAIDNPAVETRGFAVADIDLPGGDARFSEAESAPGTDHRAPAPINLESALNVAVGSDRYMVAVFHLADGRVHLFRELNGLPLGDFTIALDLLRADLDQVVRQFPLSSSS